MENTLFFLIVFFFSFNIDYAQDDSSKNVGFYLEDGGLAESRNIFKINLLSLATGDLPFFYERKLSNKYTIEAGAGILLPYYHREIMDYLDYYIPEIVDPKTGYSLWFQAKSYITDDAPKGLYFGIQYRERRYNLPERSIIYTDITGMWGFQKNISKRWVIDYNFGFGYRYKNRVLFKDEEVVLPFGLKIGIII